MHLAARRPAHELYVHGMAGIDASFPKIPEDAAVLRKP